MTKHHGIYAWFIILTLIALVIAFQHYYVIVSNTSVEYTLSWHLFFNLFYWWCWLAFYLIIKWITVRISISGKYGYWFIFYILIPLFLVSLHQLLASIVITSALGYSDVKELVINRILSSEWMWVDLVLYFIMAAGLNIFELQSRNRKISLKNRQLQSQLYNAQLDVLHSQIQPHFLFNTLNTLSTLILKEDNNEAIRMLELLKNFLRTTVYDNTLNNIRLMEEIKFIRDYLEIEKVRFKDKLEVVWEIAENTELAVVPNFILQPIVENSIHYAVAPGNSKGIIRIKSKKIGNTLEINIEDNGPGLVNVSNSKKKGLGLKITRDRLSLIFRNESRLLLESSELGGLKVLLCMPFISDELLLGKNINAINKVWN